MATFGAQVTQSAVLESTDPATLETLIANAFAAQLTAHGTSQLIELHIAAGGAGAVFQAVALFSTLESANFPSLVNQHVKVVHALDAASLQAALVAFRTAVPSAITTFSSSAVGGSGAHWCTALIYQTSDGFFALVEERDEEDAAAEERDEEDATPDELMAAVSPELLPSDHVRPSLAEFVSAGYRAKDYEAHMRSWEHGLVKAYAPIEQAHDFEEPIDEDAIERQRSAVAVREKRKVKARARRVKRKK